MPNLPRKEPNVNRTPFQVLSAKHHPLFVLVFPPRFPATGNAINSLRESAILEYVMYKLLDPPEGARVRSNYRGALTIRCNLPLGHSILDSERNIEPRFSSPLYTHCSWTHLVSFSLLCLIYCMGASCDGRVRLGAKKLLDQDRINTCLSNYF